MQILRDTIRNNRPAAETRIRGTSYEYVIVGAGIAGLSMASLLAKQGFAVLVLEAIHYPGGCASSFLTRDSWFDVGATTLSGVDPHQPLAALFAEIGDFPDRLEVRPGLAVSQNGRILRLPRHRAEWVGSVDRFFGISSGPFWKEMFTLNDALYRSLEQIPYIPPRNLIEAFRNAPGVDRDLFRFIFSAFDTIEGRLHHHGLRNEAFRSFVDNQLIITNQVGAEEALVLSGSLGLSYANSSICSVRGGMITFARFLESKALEYGSEIAYLQRVEKISQIGNRWRVETKRGTEIFADNVITQLPLEALESVTDHSVRKYYESLQARVERRGVRRWGAVTLYGLVDGKGFENVPPNLQVILKRPLALTESSSLFLSFSHPDDHDRSPFGTRTLTISTHVDPARFEQSAAASDYGAYKEAVRNEILDAIRFSIPGFPELRFEFVQVGTPRTFRKYTGRPSGYVGGLPLSKKLFPFAYPRTTSPFRGLYNLGDNFFPGQGLPGVILGALALQRRIKEGLGT